jgi:hypothetical protein
MTQWAANLWATSMTFITQLLHRLLSTDAFRERKGSRAYFAFAT